MKLEHFLTPHTKKKKKKQKWIKYLNLIIDTIKLLEEKQRQHTLQHQS